MKKTTPWFTFTKEQADALAPRIQGWFEEELELSITGLQARLLLRFFTEEAGKLYYDKGVSDAIAQLTGNVEDLYALMKSANA